MTLLIIGLVLFLGIHLVPCITALKNAMLSGLGLKGYKILYSLVSLAGFILIILGKIHAEFIHVYSPPGWGRYVAYVLMLAAFILLPAAHMKGNIKRLTRHPMLWGVVCWSVAHLLANGDLASVVLFTGFLIYSLVDMMSANFRGAQLQTQVFPIKKDVVVVIAGTVTYTVVLLLHPYLFGVAAI